VVKTIGGDKLLQGGSGDSEDNMTESETLGNRHVSSAGKRNRTFEEVQEVIQP